MDQRRKEGRRKEGGGGEGDGEGGGRGIKLRIHMSPYTMALKESVLYGSAYSTVRAVLIMQIHYIYNEDTFHHMHTCIHTAHTPP